MPAPKGPRLDGAGTPEAAWARWRLEQLPELDVDGYPRAVFVAPHPDDEVLAAAGLMQRMAEAGASVSVISVTDGEASHPSSPTVTPGALAERRAGERDQALRSLGLGGVAVHRLGLPDGGVAGRTVELTARLTAFLGPGVFCIAPWDRDGHPDHDATGRAAAAACARVGGDLLSFLVWTWHWAGPGDHRVVWERARRLPLTGEERARKVRAIRSFRSQIAPLSAEHGDEPILCAETLARFTRSFEVFLR
jgi:LmbE family N-acetylglucosaminyl deacetylase